MTRPCSCYSRYRFDPAPAKVVLQRLLAAALVVGWGAASAGELRTEGGNDGGTVTGSIRLHRATVQTDGPKHDRDVVVFLDPVGAADQPLSEGKATMDQRGLVFVPHVLAVQKGTTVTFLNSDSDQHNVYFLNDNTGETLDIGTWGPNVSVDHRFEEAGVVITLCKLHLEMSAYIVVVESPWFSIVQIDDSTSTGSFSIQGVPPGEYELTAWHKKLKQKGGAARITVTRGEKTETEVVITKARYASTSD